MATESINGLEYTEEVVDDKIFWFVKIDKPFPKNERLWFTLNKRFFEKARIRGVEKIVVSVIDKEIWFSVPTERQLKEKEKANEYKDEWYKYPEPIRMYQFQIT